MIITSIILGALVALIQHNRKKDREIKDMENKKRK